MESVADKIFHEVRFLTMNTLWNAEAQLSDKTAALIQKTFSPINETLPPTLSQKIILDFLSG